MQLYMIQSNDIVMFTKYVMFNINTFILFAFF